VWLTSILSLIILLNYFPIMIYLYDAMEDWVGALDDTGIGHGKTYDRFAPENKRIREFNITTPIPKNQWCSFENGVVCLWVEITKEEYDTFGITWTEKNDETEANIPI